MSRQMRVRPNIWRMAGRNMGLNFNCSTIGIASCTHIFNSNVQSIRVSAGTYILSIGVVNIGWVELVEW